MQKTFKTAYNRGNARVWIEGDILKANGFHHGRRFKRIMIDYTAIVTGKSAMRRLCPCNLPTCGHDKRKGKIAGTVARPIVDLNGKFMSEFMDGATHYLATFKNDTITIERA